MSTILKGTAEYSPSDDLLNQLVRRWFSSLVVASHLREDTGLVAPILEHLAWSFAEVGRNAKKLTIQ